MEAILNFLTAQIFKVLVYINWWLGIYHLRYNIPTLQLSNTKMLKQAPNKKMALMLFFVRRSITRSQGHRRPITDLLSSCRLELSPEFQIGWFEYMPLRTNTASLMLRYSGSWYDGVRFIWYRSTTKIICIILWKLSPTSFILTIISYKAQYQTHNFTKTSMSFIK